MKFQKILFPLAVVSIFTAACNAPAKPVTAIPQVPDLFTPDVDSSVSPAADFFDFANGKWLKNHPIPASETSWGIFQEVRDEINARLLKISKDAANANAPAGSDMRKIGDFWNTGMDSAKADQLGVQPLNGLLKKIDSIQDTKDVIRVMTELDPVQTGIFYGGFYITQDSKNSSVMALTLSQGGLGLEDREYYFENDSDTKAIRVKYRMHISKVLQLLGEDAKTADRNSADILSFETALAGHCRKREDLRDPIANYNKVSVDNMTKKYTPSIDWRQMCAAHGITKIDSLVVGQPEFFSGLNTLINNTNVAVLREYMRFHLVDSYAGYLSKSFVDENFDFYGHVLSGVQTQLPRWRRVLRAEQEAMGMVLGKLFVAQYFPEKTKQRYVHLVEAIRSAYLDRIKNLSWMSDSTKKKAIFKLQHLSKKVGYPDKWKDYSKLVVGTNSWCENMINASQWNFNDMISRFGKPVDRSEWDMTPQTYNAYYNPSNNEIVLPAAIFTIPGATDSLVDDAVVYGYAGASTIGHEITHGFDDEGRHFDAYGNMVDWWTAEDSKKFDERAQKMINQFDAYEPLPGKHISGKASLGENIADFGGVLLGLDAFKKTDEYKKGETIGGYTPTQRFFLGYALGWLEKQRDEDLAHHLMTDVHAPPKYRVNGPFSNVPDFYKAFGVKPGDPMYRADSVRVSIW